MAKTKISALAQVEDAVPSELDAQPRAEAINANRPEVVRKLMPIPKGFVPRRAN